MGLSKIFYTVFVFINLSLYNLYAQGINHKISFTHDNDLYFITDRYYSAGNHLSFGFGLKRKDDKHQFLNFTIGQNIYTPNKKSLPDTARFDRPFAGWLFLKTEFTHSTANDIWSLQLEMGLTGSQSLADKVQRNYHELIGEQLPSWHLQIPNDFHSNLGVQYQKGFWNNRLISYSAVKLGTKDIYIQNGLELFWGSHHKLNQNSYIGLAKHHDKEWFVNFGTYYRYVFYNALIEGHLFNDNAVFTKNTTNHLFLLKLKAFYRWKRNSIEVSYHFNTKENKDAKSQSYLGLTLSRYF
ncbi:lipid A-modifier LpxR family protein [Psychroflexus sp. MBR-150]